MYLENVQRHCVKEIEEGTGGVLENYKAEFAPICLLPGATMALTSISQLTSCV